MEKIHVVSVFLKYKSFVYLKRKKCDIFCVLYIYLVFEKHRSVGGIN